MSTTMSQAERSAFEDARREASLAAAPVNTRNAWIGTACGLVLGVTALALLML